MTPDDTWHVVLIDDEADIRDIVTITLEDAGYRVATAQDGKVGIRLVKERSPQIVVTDIRMPGMDGIEVLAAVKAHNPDIEVIVATAFGDMDLAIRALQLDASDFITKPINDQALQLALNRAKERYASRKQLKDYTALLEKEKAETAQELMRIFSFQKNLIESAMDGILGCDEDRRLVIFNRGMEQMLGFVKEEILNSYQLDRFFLPGAVSRLLDAIYGEKFGGENRLQLYETTLVGKGGQKIPVQASAHVLFDQGKELGLVCYFRDLRELRRLEQEVADQASILHQDKMMSLGRLAASVVHEINNPLSGILNYLRLMLQIINRGPLSVDRQEKFRDYLELIETETSRCSKIISNLLTFSRKSPPSFEALQISELLDRCVSLSQHKLELCNIRLEKTIDADMPPVLGDLNQLQQCIINLIFNAVDAMPDGGTLWLSGESDAAAKRIAIIVKDTGPGISQDDLFHIFEPFFTTKAEGYGVGLGLSTVYGIMERHSGSVAVESSPGQGAEFRLYLPVQA